MAIILKKASGCTVGAAAGDTLGRPTEGINKKDWLEFYGGKITSYQKALPGHPCSHLNRGQYTDDTQQLILLAESLVERKCFDIYDFGHKLGQWGYMCRTIPGYDRFSGETSLSAALDLYRGVDPHFSGKFRASCGAGMRVAPLGLFFYDNIPELDKAARESSILTHNHPVAVDSAVLVSHIVAYLMNDYAPLEAVQKSNERLKTSLRGMCIASSGRDAAITEASASRGDAPYGDAAPANSHRESRRCYAHTLKEKIQYVCENKDQRPEEIALVIGTSASALETIPMAVHCFIHSPHDFETVVINAANLVPGDTDSIACIAGALAGAFNGLDAIPKKFKENLEDYAKLELLGQKLIARN